MTFVFLGSHTEIHSTIADAPGKKFTQYGECMELTPELAASTKEHGGVPAIALEDFDACGFTPDELRKYSSTARHATAPPEFQAKKEKALAILAAQRGEQ